MKPSSFSFSAGNQRVSNAAAAMAIQARCFIKEEDGINYRARKDIEDPLYHLCTEMLRTSDNGLPGIMMGSKRVPRFSEFMVKPSRSSEQLEVTLQQAIETYGEGFVPAVLFEGGEKPFVYTSWIPENPRPNSALLLFMNRGRRRAVMPRDVFLKEFGLASKEEDS